MKKALILALLVSPISAMAWDGYFENKDFSDFCKGYRTVKYGNGLECRKAEGFLEVKNAKVGANTKVPKALWGKVLSAIDLGVLPDADTSEIYSYTRELLNEQGEIVGYYFIDGYNNSEMDLTLKMNSKYNTKGDLISVYVNE
jgi:hypothetical protein